MGQDFIDAAQNTPILQQDWAWSVRKFAEVLANKRPVKTILDDYANQIKGVLTY